MKTGDVIPVKICSESAKMHDEQHMQAQHQFNEPVLLQRNDEDMFVAKEDEHGTYFHEF